MGQLTLFDGDESELRKTDGMEQAAANQADGLKLARQIAVELCRRHGETNADQVGEVLLARHGIDTLGPAAGSIFRPAQFVFTGHYVNSTRKTNHSRLLRVWRLR